MIHIAGGIILAAIVIGLWSDMMQRLDSSEPGEWKYPGAGLAIVAGLVLLALA
jgi:hypothetical protein